MKMLSKALLAFLPLLALSVSAQEVAQPDVKVGDRWVFQVTDNLTGETTKTVTRTVFRVTDTEIHMKGQAKSKTSTNRVEVIDRQLNWLDSGVFQSVPHGGDYQFPLFVGKQWNHQYQSIGIARESKIQHEVAANVVALEKVRVLAGEFDAYRIEYVTRNTSMSDEERPPTVTKSTRWYSPIAKQMVKYNTEAIAAGRTRESVGMELIEFSSRP